MHRTRVKICGITRPQDAVVAVESGVDALGLVFYSGSTRNIGIEAAAEIMRVIPAFVTTVALFKDASVEWIEQVTSSLDFDLLQFHGSESPDFIQNFNHPYLKAIGMQGQSDLKHAVSGYELCTGFLLDSHAAGEAGGTGETFDWETIPLELRRQIILAGGINPDNVAECITRIRPYAIDVSSGVESSPGKKDQGKIEQLMKQVRLSDG